jgi:flagellar protein FlgJ
MGAGPKPSIDETLEEFQAIFLNEMMKSMREALPESGLFEGEELSRETFQSLLDQEYVRTAAHQMGGLGLTEALKWQLGLAGTAPTASQPPKEAAA